MKIGFIGLGTMGSSIAMNAMKGGHELVVYDINEEAAKPHIDAGAYWADSPQAVAEQTDVVFTSLPGPPEVEAVALGGGGLIEGLRTGQAYFDLSTNSPTLMRRIHQVFLERGVQALDAPVSGGPDGARTDGPADSAGHRCRTADRRRRRRARVKRNRVRLRRGRRDRLRRFWTAVRSHRRTRDHGTAVVHTARTTRGEPRRRPSASC